MERGHSRARDRDKAQEQKLKRRRAAPNLFTMLFSLCLLLPADSDSNKQAQFRNYI